LVIRAFRIAAMLSAAVILTWLFYQGWIYLQRGYSIAVAFEGQQATTSHISFPHWRLLAHLLLWAAMTGSIVAYLLGRHWSTAIAWLVCAATCGIGIYDVEQFGLLGSPTSIWTVVLLLVLALLTKARPVPAGPAV
jgi:hypothetical protein